MAAVETLPDRDAWLAERRKNVGGSEIAALFDCQPDWAMSRFALWQVKAGRVPEPEVDSVRAVWGQRLESVIAQGLAEDQGWHIRKGGYVHHPKIAGMACTLDYEIVGGHPRVERDGPGVFEIKAADWLVHKREWLGEPPIHIQLQAQHQCACTGRRWGVIGCLIGGNQPAEPYEFEARPKIMREIEKRVAAFWRSVRHGVEPAVDGSRSTGEIVRAMFPDAVPEKEIDLSGDNELPDRYQQLKQGRLDKRAAEAEIDAAENWLLRKIGDAAIVKSDGVVVLTAKTVKRCGFTVEPTSYRSIKLTGES